LTQSPVPSEKIAETSEKSCHDLAFTLLQDCITTQLSQVDTLDAKANAAQVAASTLVGAALVLQAVLLAGNITLEHRLIQVAALLPLLVAYAFVMYYASKGYGISDYTRVPTPATLLQNLEMTEGEMKRALIDAMGEAFNINEQKIQKKVLTIARANQALKIETGILIAVLLVQTILPYFLG